MPRILSGKEEEAFSAILEAARLCIDEDGAKVICLGSTTIHDAAEYPKASLKVPAINLGPLSYQIASTCAPKAQSEPGKLGIAVQAKGRRD